MITLVPAETPVTNPVLLTVATPVDADIHGVEVAAVPEPVNCVVAPIQALKVPVMAGKASTLLTVTVTVFDVIASPSPALYSVHVTVYVIAVAEALGVIVALCDAVNPETDAGEMVPPLLKDQSQSKATILSIGVIVAENVVP